MSDEILPGKIYEHFKGKRYRVLLLARHSETLEELVVYEALYENPLGKIWVRPKPMFLETVQSKDGPRPRFRRIE